MGKKTVSDILNEISLLLGLKGGNPFKIRAYYNAARALETLDEDIEVLVRNNKLKEVKD
ncbi:helix-hairpin-helix domain-containing protein [Petrotoga sp. SL27]|uniref:helix-hairpin-helix domain-containing protein n=1 Tax=Petrotoga sp. SL27 TaxID=1445612 RepID=UPI000CDF230B|nr:helix-hairpin-helix domain-containing protein [Petrotoga sp. SL27]